VFYINKFKLKNKIERKTRPRFKAEGEDKEKPR
jgi:hypothetical protein